MKSFCFIFLSLISIISYGQTNSDKTKTITKGYYAIGNNYSKLFIDSPRLRTDRVITPVINKGYYSIKDKNLKLAGKASDSNKQNSTPVVTKGYYSIGNNAQKLAN